MAAVGPETDAGFSRSSFFESSCLTARLLPAARVILELFG